MPGWLLVRPLTTDRTPGEPIPCAVIGDMPYMEATIRDGAKVLVRNKADMQSVEAPHQQDNSADRRKFDQLFFVLISDVCAIETPRE